MHVYIGGTFDKFHLGHLRLIKAGRKLATTNGAPVTAKLTVALNSDEFVEEYKGRRPVYSYAERWELLASIKDINQVVLNTGGAKSGPTIERFDPDIILAGADWAPADGQKYFDQLGVTARWLDERSITVLFLPRVGGHASSKPDPMLRAGARANSPADAVLRQGRNLP